jgi:PilZ domain-containing protein
MAASVGRSARRRQLARFSRLLRTGNWTARPAQPKNRSMFFDDPVHRRRHARRAVQLPARLSWQGHHFSAQTENISPGGALLNARLPQAATEVVAQIELRDGKELRVRAKVRWQRPSPPGIGIEFSTFLDASDED